ncbi:helix-turn-helix transcriptional regulator [Flavisolibacter sp. BT320]|nr:helix-turn-helix transcriptional regulator [Flavisolibacter longurius]
MIYKQCMCPSPALQAYVRNYTLLHLKLDPCQSIPVKHRPPKPEQGIVFYIKGNVTLQTPVTGYLQVPSAVSLFSHQIDKKSFQISNEFLMFTVFLRPGILHRLTGVPAIEMKQDYHDAALFLGTQVNILAEQLATANTYSLIVDIIERFLLASFTRMKMTATVDDVADYLLANPTQFSLDEIARQTYLSTKQFYRKFVERIGISPKLFSRMARFNKAYQFKIIQPYASWSSIAQEFGYTDYHHLEKEFKEFTSLTPNEWLKQNQEAPERILR